MYGTDAVFPIQLILPMAKFLQEEQDEENDMATRMSKLVELQQIREQLVENSRIHQKKIMIERKKWTVFKLVTRISNGMH